MKNVIPNEKCHSELVSESKNLDVEQMLKQVQHDSESSVLFVYAVTLNLFQGLYEKDAEINSL